MSDTEAHKNLSCAMDVLEGFATNPNRKAEEYKAMIPTVEKMLNCGYEDIEQRARQNIKELTKRSYSKKWWQFWK